MKKISAVLSSVIAATVLSPLVPQAQADNNCQTDLWGFLGSQRRSICDEPKKSNGEWIRHRAVWTPEHQVPVYCSYGRWSSSCSGGYWVPMTVQERDQYPVTDDNVLPSEPGHLG